VTAQKPESTRAVLAPIPVVDVEGHATASGVGASRRESLFSTRPDLAPLLLHRHPDHLPNRRGPVLLGRTEAQRSEDAPDGNPVARARLIQRLEAEKASAARATRPIVWMDGALVATRLVAWPTAVPLPLAFGGKTAALLGLGMCLHTLGPEG